MTPESVHEANAILREKGYKESQLGVFATPNSPAGSWTRRS